MHKLAPCLLLLLMPALAQAQPSTGRPPDGEPAEPESIAPASEAASDREPEASSEPAPAGEEEREPSELEREQASIAEPASAEVAPQGDRLDHEYQLGLRVGAGVPFVLALRYGGSAPCDNAGSATFCYFVGQPIMDFEVSFGVTRDLEVDFMTRISLLGEEPTFSNRVLLGLGIRAYIEPQSLFKLFLGVRAILDVTPRGVITTGWSDVDAGIRGEVGVQLDFVRYVGVYAQFGANILFVRALQFVPDLTGGLQARFP